MQTFLEIGNKGCQDNYVAVISIFEPVSVPEMSVFPLKIKYKQIVNVPGFVNFSPSHKSKNSFSL